MRKTIQATVVSLSLLAAFTIAAASDLATGDTKTSAAETRATRTKQEKPGLSSEQIDQLVTRVMVTFNVPGVAVGIVKDGKIVHAKGYGVLEVGKKDKVNAQTLFGIASTGKAFTAAALALLVDAGKITWHSKVIDHIPTFQLYDPWVTREFTVKDLLIHNSGLGPGAGDLMFWPTSNFSREEIIANMKYLKPADSFRSAYAYNNLMYIVAGEVIAAVSGISYENFIDQYILQPLAMNHCAANRSHLKKHNNVAEPHLIKNGAPVKTARLEATVYDRSVTAAAGGIQCSIQSILKWHAMFLNKGRLPNGDQFLSEQQQETIMTPHTLVPVKKTRREWFGTNFSTYGLGWSLEDFHGYKLAYHFGGLTGMTSANAMIPELKLGVAIYTNQQAGNDKTAILYPILEAYITDDNTDWPQKLYTMQQKEIAEAAETTVFSDQPDYKLIGSIERYADTYKDPWFGKVVISLPNNRKASQELSFKSDRSTVWQGKMVPLASDLFVVRWNDRALNADAYVKFSIDFAGRPKGFTMKAVSPLTDFSFDFHDLNFTRLNRVRQ
ncbi:serine hydrolase [Exilibacterium tricleocarpae]|uniref:Serine hydrolase n=1 Tax=Exilibacterium tricleocarpae TaxID=2591008 RepID=A0A545SPV4_9GAMM|nr:serine hydrolase [Exilibacterium tricleocarpae]TQV66984.1 serine hydrolase [Exilibacterium tricleocarpae]